MGAAFAPGGTLWFPTRGPLTDLPASLGRITGWGYGRRVSFYAVGSLIALAGAIASAVLRRRHRWLALAGVAAALSTALLVWGIRGYDDFEGPGWLAVTLLTFLYGGVWGLGVAIGFLLRSRVDEGR
jgi:hypothetical protein